MKLKKFRDFSPAQKFFAAYTAIIFVIFLVFPQGLSVLLAGVQILMLIALLALHLISRSQGIDMFSGEEGKETKKISFPAQKPFAIMLIGQSGSGKGTLAPLLMNHLLLNDSSRKVLISATGDHFRKLLKENNYTTNLIKEKNDSGELIPLAWPVMLISTFLTDHFTGDEYIIFDGSPRRKDEAKIMESLIRDFYGLEIFVIHLTVDDDTAFKRLIERHKHNPRPETSNPESIREKLSWYHKDVMPAIRYMKTSHAFVVIEVDGTISKEAVFEKVIEELFEKPAV